MLNFTATATQHTTRHGQTVDRYQVQPQNTGRGYEVVDLRDGGVIGPVFDHEHSARSFATEYNYS